MKPQRAPIFLLAASRDLKRRGAPPDERAPQLSAHHDSQAYMRALRRRQWSGAACGGGHDDTADIGSGPAIDGALPKKRVSENNTPAVKDSHR